MTEKGQGTVGLIREGGLEVEDRKRKGLEDRIGIQIGKEYTETKRKEKNRKRMEE